MSEIANSWGGDHGTPVAADRDGPVVALRGIVKRFEAVTALQGVDFEVRAGEVHALIGENGAGKSTLMKILFGAISPDEGTVLLDGRPGVLNSPRRALQSGIAMIAQELSLVPELSVAQNLFLGQEPLRAGRIDWQRVHDEATQALAAVGAAGIDVRRPVRDLSIAQRQLVEIARAVHRTARIIVMDEPTSSLPAHETEELLHVVKRLAQGGTGVVYVSHRLPEILAVADRITVLRDGKVVAVLPAAEADELGLVRRMVGRDLAHVTHRPIVAKSSEMLRVENLARHGVVGPISFSVHAGEIVGMAGLVGSGRTELVRLIFGADRRETGAVFVEGQRVEPDSPGAAIRAGIGLLPEDRKDQGLVLGMTVTSNVTLPVLRRVQQYGFLLNQGVRQRIAADLADRVHLRPPRVGMVVSKLSGGNQQKVVIAKWLATKCKVFIFDEPTRGIDVGAKAEIYRLMEDLTSRGAAILMISSELPEVLRMSDRILVMRQGRIVLDVPRSEATEDNLGQALTGAGDILAGGRNDV